jgi:hypothetical protein
LARDSKGADVTEVFGSAGSFTAVTPSDSTVLKGVRALYVGGAGTVIATNAQGADITFTVPAGATLLISPSKVKVASTATLIVALY